jgi:hypothetical protein
VAGGPDASRISLRPDRIEPSCHLNQLAAIS